MRIYNKILPFLFLVLFSQLAQGQAKKTDSLAFEVLLNNSLLKDFKIDGKFIHCLDITPGRLVLLATSNQFFLLGWGGVVGLGKKTIQERKA